MDNENIKNRILSPHPMRLIYAQTREKEIIEETTLKKRALCFSPSYNDIFDLSDTPEALENPEVMAILSNLRLGLNNSLLDDLGAALWGCYTLGDQFALVETTQNKENLITSTTFTLKLETLKRLLMGPLVTINGFGKNGTQGIIRTIQGKYIIPEILKAKPSLSIGSYKYYGKIYTVIGYPILFLNYFPELNSIQVRLDHSFYSIQNRTSKINDSYIKQFTGLTALIMFGVKLARQKYPSDSIPDAKSVVRLIKTSQAIFQTTAFVKGTTWRPQKKDKNKIEIMIKPGKDNINIKNLFPSAISHNNYINYKKFIAFTRGAAIAYETALDEIGIKTIDADVLKPCTEQSSRFEDKTAHIIFQTTPTNQKNNNKNFNQFRSKNKKQSSIF